MHLTNRQDLEHCQMPDHAEQCFVGLANADFRPDARSAKLHGPADYHEEEDEHDTSVLSNGTVAGKAGAAAASALWDFTVIDVVQAGVGNNDGDDNDDGNDDDDDDDDDGGGGGTATMMVVGMVMAIPGIAVATRTTAGNSGDSVDENNEIAP